MLIDKVSGANGSTKKIRVTEEFSTLLIKDTGSTSLETVLMSVFIERSGKNIPLCTRLSFSKLRELSGNIEEVSRDINRLGKKSYPLSFFENGNFKLNDSDAFVIELEGLSESDEFLIYGIPDVVLCTALYNYEEKNMLVGEHTKTFDLKGIERVLFPVGIEDCEIGFVVENSKGSLVEVKQSFDEFIYSTVTQRPTHTSQTISISNYEGYALLVDGISQLKIYSPQERREVLNFVFQSFYEVSGDSIVSVQQSDFAPKIENKVIGSLGNAVKIGGIGTGSNFRKAII